MRRGACSGDVGTRHRVLAHVGCRIIGRNKDSEAASNGAHGAPGSSEADGGDGGERPE